MSTTSATTAIHSMSSDLTAACGADSYDLAASWSSVTCPDCLAALSAAKKA